MSYNDAIETFRKEIRDVLSGDFSVTKEEEKVDFPRSVMLEKPVIAYRRQKHIFFQR